MQGTVRWFSEVKHYGFVTLDDGRDCFVHQNAVQDRCALHDNDRVEFNVQSTVKGLSAVNVRVISE